MKSFNKLLVLFLLSIATIWTNLGAQQAEMSKSDEKWQDYGESFEIQDVKSGQEALNIFGGMESSQPVTMQIRGEVSAVCQVKGCWMIVKLTDGEETRVRFKNYGFFVPMDIVGKEVVVNGHASVEEISESDQKHYAKDAGQSESEIDKIKGSKRTYSVIADGVLIRD